MTRYSQNLEQDYILEYFGDYVGTFLSLGENDGETFSNVRALALRNWKGVMVEPSPKAFERLKNLYNGHRGFYLYPYAIGTYNGNVILQESGSLCTPSDVALVSTISIQEMKRWVHTKEPGQDWVITFDPIEVQMFRWKTFINRLSIKVFDCVSIDCEGEDFNILSQIDLKDTKLVCIEHNGSQEKKRQYLECTSKYGIDKIIYESGENIVIVR